MKVAVIGAGATGSSAARFLAKAGHDVTVFEQHYVGHNRGSSHGTSRMIRRAYPDPFYSKLVAEAYELWADLELEAGEQLYNETGLLLFGAESSQWLKQCRNSLRENGIRFEDLGPVEVARRFGGFHLEPGEIAIVEQEAGFLRADKVIQANIRLAKAHGAKVIEGRLADVNPDGTISGTKFDAVAMCAGPWISRHIDEWLAPDLQHFAYFDAPLASFTPVWVDGGDSHYYGFPNYGRGFKVGRHMYGPIVNPDEVSHRPDPTVLEALTEEARLRLGSSSGPREWFTCLYTVAPNKDFRIGRLDWEVPAFYISGCSGHGFKFTVWFGKLMLELIEGRKAPEDYPRFCPA